MKNGGCKWFCILLNSVFALLVLLVLAASLPQMLLHDLPEKNGFPLGERIPLQQILEKKQLQEADYRLIFRQTGLGKNAIQSLRERPGNGEAEILRFQGAAFTEYQANCKSTNLLTRQDCIKRTDGKPNPLAPVEDGDILISFSSHTFGWRHGHAGIIVDAERGLCLEAAMLGCNSELKNLNHWKNYSNFAILRLKEAPMQKRADVARFARNHLNCVPYSLISGLIGEKAPSPDSRITAQCAYLVWYAYAQFGYDLDADGGRIVSVKDLSNSPLLEIIQIFCPKSAKGLRCTGN